MREVKQVLRYVVEDHALLNLMSTIEDARAKLTASQDRRDPLVAAAGSALSCTIDILRLIHHREQLGPANQREALLETASSARALVAEVMFAIREQYGTSPMGERESTGRSH
ncbi:hypothetical protein GCM10012275_00310 [Longimycelium tulufanense]|uniref:Uncharacterized protein n=2 Tax=Longimycelium tulufanense TaxID=907463 RepID=A0A8J3C8E3_9PSEU|nr:hypothetical protein GCM10012275_00310 [Longimycelium tulufanense]